MRRNVRIGLVVASVVVAVVIVYTGVIGFIGSGMLVSRAAEAQECATPGGLYRWAYEAINYDIADDVLVEDRRQGATFCTYEGTKAGTDVVTSDGVRIAGWYIPAANGAGPVAPTIVLVHGINGNKTRILRSGVGLHQTFNLVAFDMRASGRSTGDARTAGVYEQRDLRAILDWLERTKQPAHIGLLGESLGAATALAEMRDDPRVEAVVLDSMHTKIQYQVAARTADTVPSYVGTTWAIIQAIRLRTGADIESIDPDDTIRQMGDRPILVIHGATDAQDLLDRTRLLVEQAKGRGMDIELQICPASGHGNGTGQMPSQVCVTDYGTWSRDFFTRQFGSAAAQAG